MLYPQCPQRAFTLIEVMVSIGIGMLIVLLAVKGIMVTAQTISRANHLSVENSILQAGILIGLEEIDTWRGHDDPESENKKDRVLRNEKLPFSPIEPYQPQPINGDGFGAKNLLYKDDDVGWDPNYQWPPNDPRTWWRANLAEKREIKGSHPQSGVPIERRRFGDYTLVSNDNPTYPTTYVWLNRQMQMLHESLGYYAFCDYLPPSMPLAPMRDGELDRPFIYHHGHFTFTNGTPQTRAQCSSYSFYVFPRIRKSEGEYNTDLEALENVARIQRDLTDGAHEIVRSGILAHKEYRQFEGWTQQFVPAMDQCPETWPTLNVSVSRFLLTSRFVAMCKVRCSHPLTGRELTLSFPGIGTTLRGARNMRKPGSPSQANGWAHWYGPGDSRNDPTIDNPTGVQ